MFVLNALLWLVLLPIRLIVALLWIPWLLLKLVLAGVLFLVIAPIVALLLIAGLVVFAILV